MSEAAPPNPAGYQHALSPEKVIPGIGQPHTDPETGVVNDARLLEKLIELAERSGSDTTLRMLDIATRYRHDTADTIVQYKLLYSDLRSGMPLTAYRAAIDIGVVIRRSGILSRITANPKLRDRHLFHLSAEVQREVESDREFRNRANQALDYHGTIHSGVYFERRQNAMLARVATYAAYPPSSRVVA